MRALSIRQPWAELILAGRKTIETRTWNTSYRGPIAIHAGWIIEEEVCQRLGLDPGQLTRGGLIGTVEIQDTFKFDLSTWQSLRVRHCVSDPEPEGRYGWRLVNPKRFQRLIPLRGLPGLFPLPQSIVEQFL